MKKYLLKCKTITPLFMGGAFQQPELRTQSINGLLRWWFRISGGSIEDEKRIFGWAGETSNQGLVRIYLNEPNFNPSDFSLKGQKGYEYLGFSLKITKRKAVPENTKFEVKILFHPKSTEDDVKKFFCALWLAFNLGNFGSRARRGFGSIRIEKIEKIDKIKGDKKDITNEYFGLSFVPKGDLGDWITSNFNKIKGILNASPRHNIPSLFNNFEIYLFDYNKSWQELLDKAGNEYREFRRKKSLGDRIVFGLPIVSVGRYRNFRRASLLIFKILGLDENNYALLFIVIKPNETHEFIFHPDMEKLHIKWSLLSEFVNKKTKIYP